jgi:ATP-dependent RNA helicase SUPV3L1/SUV3
MQARSERRVAAVLGPTNTGKTHLAIDRMLGHGTGMIGFPLRLLARENYDRIVRAKGANAVALVTGEERITPPNARYFVCTVESMPVDRRVDFLAVDEIQLAADAERGHVFTHRLLHARGLEETMLLGADTVRPLLKRLVPEAEFVARPRLSTLTYAGPRKLVRLPPRSAVVAFSAADVYAIAELVRRQRGGTAVVMGALSPRTRNAQVALFQSGEVDYLVATDAIGMGLNMDLSHVAFASLSKFDGRGPRRLTPAELAQIAGRAGRHMNDGTFGTTANLPGLAPEVVDAIENHRFDPVAALFWRNGALDFRSVDALLRSLEARPPEPGLIRMRDADDHQALIALLRDPDIAGRADNPERLRLLWEVCQVPDFRKILSDSHARLLGRIFTYLTAPDGDGRLPEDWVADQVARLDRVDGDIETLTGRISHIRTWTYLAHRGDWLADCAHWQGRARAIEDRLSDALHDRLTQRFVDRRSATLIRRMAGGAAPSGSVNAGGDVVVEGHRVGRLDGFRFVAEDDAQGEDARSLFASARRALAHEVPRRLNRLERAEDSEIALAADGAILWADVVVARLTRGDSLLAPRVDPVASDLLDGVARERLRRRLAIWLEREIGRRLAPLVALRQAPLAGAARGLAYQLLEAGGLLPARQVAAQLQALTPEDRRALGRHGVRIGLETVWLPALAARPAMSLLAILARLASDHRGAQAAVPAMRPPSLVPDGALPGLLYAVAGYRVLGELAVRADALERLARAARQLGRQGPFAPTEALRTLVGCSAEALPGLLQALGYARRREAAGDSFEVRRRAGSKRSRHKAGVRRPDLDSPFAALGALRRRG